MGELGLLLILVLLRAKIKKPYLFCMGNIKKYRFWYIPGNYSPTVLCTVSMRIGTQLFSSLRIQFRVRILVGFCRRKNFYMKNILYVSNNIGNILAPGSESHIPNTDSYSEAQCCGSGSGIWCFFDSWIRDPE
jgi:hypothetical protein